MSVNILQSCKCVILLLLLFNPLMFGLKGTEKHIVSPWKHHFIKLLLCGGKSAKISECCATNESLLDFLCRCQNWGISLWKVGQEGTIQNYKCRAAGAIHAGGSKGIWPRNSIWLVCNHFKTSYGGSRPCTHIWALSRKRHVNSWNAARSSRQACSLMSGECGL